MKRPGFAESRRSRGMTLVELAVYLFLVTLILSGLLAILRTEAQVDARMQGLDTLHEVRQASWKLSRALTFGTRIAHPPVATDSSPWFDKLLFTDQWHRPCLVFLDPTGCLKMGTADGRIERLAAHVTGFGVKRVDESLVLYRIEVPQDKGRKTFLLSNTILLRNTDLARVRGEP